MQTAQTLGLVLATVFSLAFQACDGEKPQIEVPEELKDTAAQQVADKTGLDEETAKEGLVKAEELLTAPKEEIKPAEGVEEAPEEPEDPPHNLGDTEG